MFQPTGAYRCSTCNLNYPYNGRCEVCTEPLSFLANAKPSIDLAEQIDRANRVAPPLVPEEDKVFKWRRDRLIDAGIPPGYAEAFAREREFDLHHLLKVFEGAQKQHGEEKGFELALEILL